MIRHLFLSSSSRQRMTSLASATVLFALCTTATDQIAPLWATTDLGLDAAGWAYLRGLRLAGITIGIVGLGLLAEYIGSRRMAMLSLGSAGIALALVAGGSAQRAFWLFPIFGALISTTYVNFNVLAQHVSERRAGIANGIYRAVSHSMVIIAPALATSMGTMMDSYVPVLSMGALLLGGAAAIILSYPLPHYQKNHTFSTLTTELFISFRNRPLWRYILMDQLMSFTMGPIMAFGALRLTRELGMSDHNFGLWVCAIGGLIGLMGIIAAGIASRHYRLNTLMGIPWLICACAGLLFGSTQSLILSTLAVILAISCWAIPTVPGSLWLAHVTNKAPIGLTVHKLAQAATGALSMAFCGFLEPHFGISLIVLGSGIVGLPIALWMLCLPNPPSLPHSE